MKLFSLIILLFTTFLLFGQTCESTGTVVVFSNYDGGYLNINVNQNIPNLKIGIASYEPSEVNIYGDFVANVVEVHYAGYFPSEGTGNFHCDPSLATASINAPAGVMTTIVSNPTPTLLTPLDPVHGQFGITIGDNDNITGCHSCDNDNYQGGGNTAAQIGDYFATYFGEELRFLKTQYPCWCGEYNLDPPPTCCFEVATSGTDATIIITGPSAICSGETAILTANGGYDSYLWSTGETGTNIVITEPGIYTVVGINECGQGTGEIEIEDCVPIAEDCTNGIDDDGDGNIDLFDDDCPCELWSDLNVSIDSTPLLCYEDSNATITAIAENGLPPYFYNWTNENATIGNGISVENLPAGLYELELTDSYGCTTDALMTIGQPEELVLSTIISPIACEGDPLGIIDAVASGGTPPYLFALDGAPFNVQSSFPDLSAGFYQLEIEDANGCRQLLSDLEIEETPILSLSLGSDQTICLGEFITLKPEVFPSTDDLTFSWSSSTIIPCDTCQQLNLQPIETATYQLTVNNLNGCNTSASLTINVTTERSLYVPNIFSPNNDGVNDQFQVFPGKSIATLSMQMYDRWGGLVFEGDPQQGWSGKVGTQLAANGVYLYVLHVTYLDGFEEVQKGDVVLVR